MRFLCEGYTTGGPIAILQQQFLPLWDAHDDYLEALTWPKTSCLRHKAKFKNTCPINLVDNQSDGNFHVFCDSKNFAVVCEIYGEEGYELKYNLPDFERAVSGVPLVEMRDFGGTLLVFDATIPGNAINLRHVGCYHVGYGIESKSPRCDAALIKVDAGDWQVIELHAKTPDIEFSGVWFQLIR